MEHRIFTEILAKLDKEQTASLILRYDGGEKTRYFMPKERLILLGAGHVAQPVCKIASMLDFDVVVVDDRPEFANRERFPDAGRIVCEDYYDAICHLQITPFDYVCIITRGHMHDMACLRYIMDETMPKYLGMIGSKRKVIKVLDLLREEGYREEVIRHIEAPIGLDINAKTTSEIAISIVAQLIAYRRGIHEGGSRDQMTMTTLERPVLEALADTSGTVALAVVLETQGSTPGKSGCLMAVDKTKLLAGTIGGGSGEARVIRQAQQMLEKKEEQRLLWIDMTNEDAGADGMVCGGRMQVLVELVN